MLIARGSVKADTPSATGDSYNAQHSVIRSGLEIEGESVVVAMEYHFEDNTSSHNFRLSSFLAPYLPSMGSCRS